MSGQRVFVIVVALPTGQRSFEVYAIDGAHACAAVEMLLRGEGLSGPFGMVVAGGHGCGRRPSWLEGAA